MPTSASITVTANHEPGPGQSQVTEDIADVGKSSLNGSADENGASTEKEVPNNKGGKDKTEQTHPIPPGKTAGTKTVRISMNCANGNTISITDTGNVSASGKVNGECIETEVVNTSVVNGVTKKVTSTQKKCCNGGQNASFVTPDEFIAFKAEILALLQSAGQPAENPKLRAWLGFSPQPHELKGVAVGRMIPRSPAAIAGLEKGDVVTAIGDAAVADLESFHKARASIYPGATTKINLLRDNQPLTISLVAARPLFLNRDVPGNVVGDKTCDTSCVCTQNAPNAVCASYWSYKGEGPNGGVLYEMSCTAFGANDQVIADRSCGTGEYI